MASSGTRRNGAQKIRLTGMFRQSLFEIWQLLGEFCLRSSLRCVEDFLFIHERRQRWPRFVQPSQKLFWRLFYSQPCLLDKVEYGDEIVFSWCSSCVNIRERMLLCRVFSVWQKKVQNLKNGWGWWSCCVFRIWILDGEDNMKCHENGIVSFERRWRPVIQ